MGLDTTMTIEIALAIGVISAVLFQLSGDGEERSKQKVSAGIMIGIYLILFGAMAIFLLPLNAKSCLTPNLTFAERIFAIDYHVSITPDETEALIETQIQYAIMTVSAIFFFTVEKYKINIARTDVKTTVLTAITIVFYINIFYAFIDRYLYRLQSSIWIHVIYVIYMVLSVLFSVRYLYKKIAEESNN